MISAFAVENRSYDDNAEAHPVGAASAANFQIPATAFAVENRSYSSVAPGLKP
jgi:hypothetical protein